MGLGYMGRVHWNAACALGAAVTAVATRRPAHLPPEARSGEAPAVFDNYDEFLRRAPVDAVLICLPTWLHERYTVAACASGRHVLCEKPLALDAAAARRMAQAADVAGVILMAAQVLRFWPQYEVVRREVRAGRVGVVRDIHAARLGAYPAWGDWFRAPEKSGGALLDLQIHDLDFLCSLLGPPHRLQCAAAPSAQGTAGSVHTWLWFETALAAVAASYALPPSWSFRAELRVVGETGAVEYGLLAPANISGRSTAEQRVTWYPRTGQATDLPAEGEDPYQAQLRYFLDCAERRQAPLRCLPADSVAVVALADACRRSAAAGGAPISLSENLP